LSKKTAGKAGLIILFIAIAVGSVFGIFGGIIALAWTGDNGWLALIIGSVVAFIGSILGIFFVIRGKRIPKAEREKKPTRHVITWSIIAIISAVCALLSYFLGIKFTYSIWLFTIIIALFAVLFLVSIFILIFGGKQETKEETEDFLTEEVEIVKEDDIENQ